MELDYLKLTGYKPTTHAGLWEIEYTPHSPYQLILGTNGCGKSSFLSQLSMLPAVPGDYFEGGSKHWEGHHGDKQYVLKSEVGKKTARHSFLVIYADGTSEELNPGGTGQVQKELVNQHVRLTPELHDVLLGRNRFTAMSPAKRREWFQLLAPVDVTVALEMYNHWRSRARDLLTIHKYDTNQLVEMGKTVMSEEDYQGLETQITIIKRDLTEYMEAKIPGLDTRYPPVVPYQQITQLSQSLLSMEAAKDSGYSTLGEVQYYSHKYSAALGANQDTYNRYLEDFYTLDKEIQAMGGQSDVDLGVQENRIALLKAQLTQYDNIVGIVPDSMAEVCSQILSDRIPELCEALLTLPPTQPHYSRERYVALQESKLRGVAELEGLAEKLGHLQMELRRIDTTDAVVCPKCTTEFKPGIDQSLRDNISHQIDLTVTQITLGKENLVKLEENIEEIERWRTTQILIGRLLKGDAIDVFRGVIVDDPLYLRAPSMLIPIVNCWLPTLREQQHRFHFATELTAVETAYEAAKAANNSARKQQLQHLNQRHAQLEITLADWLDRVESCKRKLKTLAGLEKMFLLQETQTKELTTILNEAHRAEVVLAQMDFNRRMDELISTAQSRLALLESRRITADNAVSNAQRIRQGLDLVMTEHKAALELSAILSPVDGLIAEQLTSSISSIVAEMDDIIAKVWTYDLEIMPCGLESGELDYKFPLRIRGEDDTIVGDISLGSDSQIEIVNFAFRGILSKYLDLSEYPMYLDELGREFDEAHGPRVMRYVKSLVEGQKVSQIFLISHNPALHTVFTLADINILHTENVTVAANYNQYLTLSKV